MSNAPNLTTVLGPNEPTLITLEERVRQRLASTWLATKYAQEGQDVPVVHFGRKAREEQLNTSKTGANRVCIMPGIRSGDSISHGTLELPRQRASGNTNALNPRAAFGAPLEFELSIWAVDNSDLRDERKQYAAIVAMTELVLSSCAAACAADFKPWLGKIHQDKVSINRPYGTEWIVPCSLSSLFFFPPRDHIAPAVPVVAKNPAS